MKISENNLFFSETRFNLPAFSRSVLRIISYAFYIFLIIATVLVLFSDVKQLRWMGIFIIPFLLYKAIRQFRSRKSIRTIKYEDIAKGINVCDFFSPKSLELLERAFYKTKIIGGNFYLNLLDILIQENKTKLVLDKMGISRQELSLKIDEAPYYNRVVVRGEADDALNPKDLIGKAEFLAKKAFLQVFDNQRIQVEPFDLFLALVFVQDKEINRIFYLFSIDLKSLRKANYIL
ncbi:MAG: hypothetical protein NUV83_00465 [Candidatus Wolfebacteria bacterium]|nr:hypothetical protein [Candidatus Wolfebacteria bacterium]